MRLIILAACLFLLSATSSFAQRIYCPLPEDGTWVNAEAKPKEISRIEVESKCENNQVRIRLRAFTSCIPRDCKWGWTDASMRSDGVIQVLLVGFLSSKQIKVKAFGDLLDAHVINVSNDASSPRTDKTYNLQRK
ncbi:hypothetical protein LP7551_03095 [Roseibium album]|nr:hypothetical protein LP7551_03095 [Roseibium album]